LIQARNCTGGRHSKRFLERRVAHPGRACPAAPADRTWCACSPDELKKRRIRSIHRTMTAPRESLRIWNKQLTLRPLPFALSPLDCRTAPFFPNFRLIECAITPIRHIDFGKFRRIILGRRVFHNHRRVGWREI